MSPCPQCSASCGGGVQRRLVKCVNSKSETEEEEERAQCDHESSPENTQKCNIQECENITFGKCTVCSHLYQIRYPTYKVYMTNMYFKYYIKTLMCSRAN